MPRPSVRTRAIRAVLAVLLGVAAVPAASAPAAARKPDPNPAATYLIAIRLSPGGRAHVTEKVDLTVDGSIPMTDFDVPYTMPVGGGRYQLTRVRNLRVRPMAGAPTPAVNDDGTRMEVTARHPTAPPRPATFADEFQVAFDLDHAVTTSGGRVRFAWDPIGTSQDGVRHVHVSLGAPGGVRAASCGLDDERGHLDPCPRPAIVRGRATYDVAHLPTARGFTVRADLKPGSVAAAPPHATTFDAPHTAHASPRPAAPALAVMAVLLALAVAAPWYARRRARPSGTVAEPGLPDGMTPALASLIAGSTRNRRRATGIAAAVTLTDLARRGHLRIEAADGDWRFTRPPSEEAAPAAAPYETRLLDEVFTGTDEVLLSHLNGRYDLAEDLLDGVRRDARERGWLTGALVRPVIGAVPVVLGLCAVDIVADRPVTGWPFVAAGLVALAASVTGFVLPQCRLTRTGRAAYDLAFAPPIAPEPFAEQVVTAFSRPSALPDPARTLRRLEEWLTGSADPIRPKG